MHFYFNGALLLLKKTGKLAWAEYLYFSAKHDPKVPFIATTLTFKQCSVLCITEFMLCPWVQLLQIRLKILNLIDEINHTVVNGVNCLIHLILYNTSLAVCLSLSCFGSSKT